MDSSIQAEDAADLGSRFRVALVSDTHGQLDPRIAKVVERCRVVVHAGDIGSVAVLDTLARSDRATTTSLRNGTQTSTGDLRVCRGRPRSRCRAAGGDARTSDRERGAPAWMAARALSRCPGRGVRTHSSALHRSQRAPVDRQPRCGRTEPDLRRAFAGRDRHAPARPAPRRRSRAGPTPESAGHRARGAPDALRALGRGARERRNEAHLAVADSPQRSSRSCLSCEALRIQHGAHGHRSSTRTAGARREGRVPQHRDHAPQQRDRQRHAAAPGDRATSCRGAVGQANR